MSSSPTDPISCPDQQEDLAADDNESFFEVVDSGEGQNERTNLIDAVVGKLEDILVDESFESVRLRFCEENCLIFEEGEENKLEYTEAFRSFRTSWRRRWWRTSRQSSPTSR